MQVLENSCRRQSHFPRSASRLERVRWNLVAAASCRRSAAGGRRHVGCGPAALSHIAAGFAIAALLAGSEKVVAQLPGGLFTDVRPVANVNVSDPFYEFVPAVSPNGLELYFTRGGAGLGENIWVAKRNSTNEEFGSPAMLGPAINGLSCCQRVGSLSADGLELYFDSSASGPAIWKSTRNSLDEDFGANPSVNLASVDLPESYGHPYISQTGLELFFQHGFGDASVGYTNIWRAERASLNDDFGAPQQVPNINTATDEYHPTLSPDGLTLFFSDWVTSDPRPGGNGWGDIWYATRPSIDEPFDNVRNVGGPLNGLYGDVNLVVSSDWPADGSTAYFTTTRPELTAGAADIWQATWVAVPPGDNDMDGDVDGYDFLQWQRGESPNPLSASDFTDWGANYGAAVSLSTNSSQVPEPTTALLPALASALFVCFRRQQRG